MKTKFICLTPISREAKFKFDYDMLRFHSCRVKNENDDGYYVESLNKICHFWVDKNSDPNWRIEK
jgi:hypothetical protein